MNSANTGLIGNQSTLLFQGAFSRAFGMDYCYMGWGGDWVKPPAPKKGADTGMTEWG